MSAAIRKIKKIKARDALAVIIFIAAVPFAIVNRINSRKRPIWLICELKDTAHDNGYHFFKYMRTKYPEMRCYYAIDKHSLDYEKVKKYGNVINYGSFRHWVYYLSAEYNISSHKEGNPNHALFTLLHLYCHLFNNRVFLQHGITKDDAVMFYYKNTFFKYFICGARREYEYIKNKFGYPEEAVLYTGFSRFDNLADYDIDNKVILVTPTWRRWFEGKVSRDEFEKSDYYKRWNGFFNNKELVKFINTNNLKVVFFPHYGIRKYSDSFTFISPNIEMINDDKIDIQELLKKSPIMITDYSSVSMDFAYMEKPVIYYQFDANDYRSGHFKQGYFDYEKDGFGEVVDDEKCLVELIKDYYANNYSLNKKYRKRIEAFFELRDDRNSERIVKELLKRSRYENK